MRLLVALLVLLALLILPLVRAGPQDSIAVLNLVGTMDTSNLDVIMTDVDVGQDLFLGAKSDLAATYCDCCFHSDQPAETSPRSIAIANDETYHSKDIGQSGALAPVGLDVVNRLIRDDSPQLIASDKETHRDNERGYLQGIDRDVMTAPIGLDVVNRYIRISPRESFTCDGIDGLGRWARSDQYFVA